jgi:hypothetical protein
MKNISAEGIKIVHVFRLWSVKRKYGNLPVLPFNAV